METGLGCESREGSRAWDGGAAMSFTPPEARLKGTCGALERLLRDMPVLPALPALEETC